MREPMPATVNLAKKLQLERSDPRGEPTTAISLKHYSFRLTTLQILLFTPSSASHPSLEFHCAAHRRYHIHPQLAKPRGKYDSVPVATGTSTEPSPHPQLRGHCRGGRKNPVSARYQDNCCQTASSWRDRMLDHILPMIWLPAQDHSGQHRNVDGKFLLLLLF